MAEEKKRKWKTWQIVVAVFFGITILGNLLEDNENNETPEDGGGSQSQRDSRSGEDEKEETLDTRMKYLKRAIDESWETTAIYNGEYRFGTGIFRVTNTYIRPTRYASDSPLYKRNYRRFSVCQIEPIEGRPVWKESEALGDNALYTLEEIRSTNKEAIDFFVATKVLFLSEAIGVLGAEAEPVRDWKKYVEQGRYRKDVTAMQGMYYSLKNSEQLFVYGRLRNGDIAFNPARSRPRGMKSGEIKITLDQPSVHRIDGERFAKEFRKVDR